MQEGVTEQIIILGAGFDSRGYADYGGRPLTFFEVDFADMQVCCSVVQCGAVCCSVLQSVAVCCRVLHRVDLCRVLTSMLLTCRWVYV